MYQVAILVEFSRSASFGTPVPVRVLQCHQAKAPALSFGEEGQPNPEARI